MFVFACVIIIIIIIIIITTHDTSCTYDVTFRRVHVTTVVVEKQ
jgi:hypothetical protein